MNSSALSRILKSFTGPPSGRRPSADDWNVIESAIGRLIPHDYKAIVEHTGGCPMGGCFLRNPAVHDNVFIALSHAALVREQLLLGEMALEMLGIELYPEPMGWIQLAKRDRVFFMLKPEGDDIAIVDLEGLEVIKPNLIFSELMWTMFSNPALFDSLGESIWDDRSEIFQRPIPSKHH